MAIFSGILRRRLWRNREVGAILSSRSWEDCIVNTSRFDFRYGQVYRWAYDYSVPGAINLCRDSHHAMMAPIGASKNSIVMLTARFPKRRVRPVGCATKSCSAWENDGDEARFLRFFKLCGEYAAARAPYESPRLSAIAAGKLGNEPDVDDDPHERLMRIIENWIAADEAERTEEEAARRAQGLPATELEAKDLRIASLEAEVAHLRAKHGDAEPIVEGEIVAPEQVPIVEGEIVAPEQVPADVKPAPTGTVSGAEAERRRLAVNADRSAYQQQGLRPAGGEPWRGHTWRFE